MFNKKFGLIALILCIVLTLGYFAVNTGAVSTVLLAIQGAIIDGNLVKFNGTNGIGVDTGLSATNVVKCKFDATSAPTVNNDVDEGYTVGSRWLDVTNDKSYVCLDNTDGAAVWTETTGAGYINLTSFVDQTAWRVFYSNADGDVIELALGTDGQYLGSTGATSAPIFDTPAGGESNTASNIGAQVEIFKQKDGVDLEFRTLKAASNKVIVTMMGEETIQLSIGQAGNTDNAVVTYYSGDKKGQSFEFSESTSFDTIQFYIKKYNSGKTMNVEVYEADGDDKPTGGVLASGSFSSTAVDSSYEWFEVSLSATVNCTGSQKYIVVMYCVTVQGIYWLRTDATGYTDGMGMYYVPATWNNYGSYDFGIKLILSAQTLDYVVFDIVESEIRLDDLKATEDNADLNASTSAHGLLKKLDNEPAHFLDGQGNWSKVIHKVITIADGDATPDVSGGGIFVTQANTGATEITDLDNPTVGQVIILIGGSNTNSSTITDGGNFALDGGITLGLDKSITLFVQADNDYVEVCRNTFTAKKLSDFAATTSAELAGVISDETGTGKLVYNIAPVLYQNVTTSTTTNTLTVAEAGLILVSNAHTETLPTAVGNAGLTYHFIKTDADYDLITLEGDGAETFNYENSTGTPNLTYLRLNTYCAEVTIVSDGTNWQVTNEVMGQVPECLVHLSADLQDISDGGKAHVLFDTEIRDIGSNYDISVWFSGNTTSAVGGKLVDSGASFTGDLVGVRVKDITDSGFTYITAIDSGTTLSVRDDIFADGDEYEILNSKFVCPVSGQYSIKGNIGFNNIVADKRYFLFVYKNTGILFIAAYHSANTDMFYCLTSGNRYFSKDDEIKLVAQSGSGDDLVHLAGYASPRYTYMNIRLISKD